MPKPRATILLAGLLMSGCIGVDVSRPPKKSKPKPPPASKLNATPGTMDAYGAEPKREQLWSISWERAEVSTVGESPVNGDLRIVHGQIYRDGKPELNFRAKIGRADNSTRTLHLSGAVHITSLDRGSVLDCDEFYFLAGKRLIHAHGNVRIVDEVGTIGPLPDLSATSDLKKVGTPDMFGQAPLDQDVHFQSRDGQFELKCKSFEVAQLQKNQDRMTGIGNVEGSSASQNLEMKAGRIVADVTTSGNNSRIDNSELDGQAEITRHVSAGSAVRKTVIQGSHMTYLATGNAGLVRVQGPVTITDLDDKKRESLHATGRTGTAQLADAKRSGSSALRQATLNGNVAIDLYQAKAAPTDHGGKIHATGNTLTYDAAGKTVTLRGNVTVTGENVSSGNLSMAVLDLNNSNEVVGMNYKVGG